MRLIRRGVALLIVVSAVVAFKLLVMKSDKEIPSKPKERAWSVQVMEAHYQGYTTDLLLYGSVESPSLVTLSSPVSAYVQATPLLAGAAVEQGKPLLQLDLQDVLLLQQQRQASVDELKAQLQNLQRQHAYNQQALQHEKTLYQLAEKAVQRNQTLKQRNLTSDASLDAAQQTVQQQALLVQQREYQLSRFKQEQAQLNAALMRAEALLQQVTLDLQRAQLFAPFDARIATLQVAAGERVTVGQPLLSVYQPSALEVKAQIPQRYLSRVQQGLQQNATISATLLLADHNTVEVSLARLSSTVSGGDAGVNGYFQLKHAVPVLALGQTVALRMHLPAAMDSIAVPSAAIYGENRVYKVSDKRMKAVTVQRLGDYLQDGKVWQLIASEQIQAGDTLVLTPLPNAIDGLLLNISDTAQER